MDIPRSLIFATALVAAAAPCNAQAPAPELEVLRAQQAAAQRRAIDQENQLQALDTRLRADSAAAPLEHAPVRLPVTPYPVPGAPSAAQAASSYPSIPDAALQDSNRRVQAAAKARR